MKLDDKEPNQPKQMNNLRWSWLALLFFTLALLASQSLLQGFFGAKKISWVEFKVFYQAGDVDRLEVINREFAEVYIKETSREKEIFQEIQKNIGPHYTFVIGSVENLENKIDAVKEEFELASDLPITYVTRTNWMANLLSWLIPFALILGLFYYMTRRIRMPGGNNPFDFGKSKAREFDETTVKQPKFDDVAGHESAKIEIIEIVEFLKNPARFTKLGAKIPKGVMLAGPPGTGKTLMARAVAGEAEVPFFSISGSEFVEMFVGVGASRVRDLFKKAKEKAPSIIFIDEIDAVGRSRGAAFSMQSNDERESTLNQLLTEMDGFGDNAGVIVMAATNRPDILDKALLRPGRFDRHIYLELPTIQEREEIFKVHTRRLTLCKDLALKQLAAQSPGFSGADIANISNEAALIAARKDKHCIEQQDFDEAIDRVIGGLERKGKIISSREKEIIAYHESGHALTSWFQEDAEKLVKLTIVPRGKSLGAAWYQPEEHAILTKSQLKASLVVALGGRAAEEIIFHEISSGALDDLEKSTKQAYTMVALYGMSDKIKNLSYYDSSGKYEQSLQKPYSDATSQLIDEEVKAIIDQAYTNAKKILTTHEDKLRNLAKALLEKEILYQTDLFQILGEPQNTSKVQHHTTLRKVKANEKDTSTDRFFP